MTSFTEGTFNYTVQRPSVPGLSRFAGRALDTAEAMKLQRNFGLLAKGLNKKTVTLWGVGSIGTDHSYQDKHGRHIIVADPRRLSQPDRNSAPQTGLPRLTNANVASVTGAVIHEVAHTLYTPKLARLSGKELAVFRVYEDAYINALILNERLPGATPLIQYAFNWSNPRPQLLRSMEQAVTAWEEQPTFKAAIAVLGSADFVARLLNVNASVKVPNTSLVALLNKVQPISDTLSAGVVIEWDDRLKLYRKIAKAIDACISPDAATEPSQPEPKSDSNLPQPAQPDPSGEDDGDDTGDDDTQDEGQPSPEYGDPDPDQDDSDWDDDGNAAPGEEEEEDEEGTEEHSQYTASTQRGNQPPQPDQTPEPEDAGDDLTDTYGDDAADVLLTCEDTTPERGQTGAALSDALARANHATVATEEDGVVLGDGLYEKAQPGQYTVKGIDQKRIDSLAKVFKAKSNVRRAVVHGLDEGRISGRRLGRLVSGTSKNVFKARPNFRQESAAVLLLVDGSGSMAGANYDGAALAAYELFASLNGNNDYAVYAWVYTGSTTLNIVGASLDGKVLSWPRGGGGSTPSHEAMVEAAAFLKKRHGDATRLIVHFTDLGYTDRPTPEFNALDRERGLAYISVSVVENPDNFVYALAQSQRVSPLMKVSGYTSTHLVQAVQELVARTF
jgi:hypothetical protein